MKSNPFNELALLVLKTKMRDHIPECRLAWWLIVCVSFACPGFLRAQPAAIESSSVASTNSTPAALAEQITALQLQMTNAWQRVIRIVNQPVQAYVKSPNMSVSTYSPGWFHEGATRPDFNSVDVRQTQDLLFAKHEYVTSDLNPGVVFLGRDLEFNSMTKFFYVNRSLPKHKLTEAEMIEINQLYRVIGHCEAELARLQAPAESDISSSGKSETDTDSAEPGQPLASIRSISREKRILYGGIAIGTLIVIVLAGRLLKRRSE